MCRVRIENLIPTIKLVQAPKSDNQINPVMLILRPVHSFKKYCNNTIPFNSNN